MRGGTIPYRPEALAKRNENRAKWPAADPEAKCYMLGVPRVTYHNMPFQIFQGEGDLLMVYPFAAANRVIYMTDRSELPVDSWMGKSDGAWDGDVLVVTTKWQNGQSWLDRAGNHASNQLTVTERFTLLGPNHLSYEATLDDPQTYTRPWTIEMPLVPPDRPAGATARAQVRHRSPTGCSTRICFEKDGKDETIAQRTDESGRAAALPAGGARAARLGASFLFRRVRLEQAGDARRARWS